jgi:F0F1-type ATP synthase alpha subunit
LDQVPIDEVVKYEQSLREFFIHRENKLLINIEKEADLTDSMLKELGEALSAFNHNWLELKGENQ